MTRSFLLMLLLAVFVPAVGHAQATVTRGPYLQSASSTAITVRWRTSIATSTRVAYGGTPGGYSTNVTDPALTTEHEVRLSGLAEGSAWYYAVGTTDALLTPGDASYSFRLAPAPGALTPVRAWIVGDSGLDNLQSRAVRDEFASWSGSDPPDVWLMLGDNAYTAGLDAEYQAGCFGLYAQAMRHWPLYSTRGNHDLLYAGAGNDYYDHFTLPSAGEAGGVPSASEAYYAFDWGPVHFVCLDSEGSDRTLGGPMIQWLRRDLAATAAPWVVCYWHHPPYTRGTHNSDNPLDSEGKMRDMRERVLPILDSTGVDLVLCGHSHTYERSYLLNGHYGLAASLTPAMKLGAGDGRPDGSGPYTKAHSRSRPFEGAVYTVAGSSAQVGAVTAIPCMVTSLSAMGSMVIDVVGNRLDARFLDATGAVRDSFAIVKGMGSVAAPLRASSLRLSAPFPNPAKTAVTFEFELAAPGDATLDVLDASGRRVARLAQGAHATGTHRVTWRGTLAHSRPAAAGLYWAVLTSAGETRVKRIVLEP